MELTPTRVGILIDYPTRPNAPSDMVDAIRLVIDEAVEAGRVDRPVEFIERQVLGLPNGSYRVVQRAFDELVEEGCLVIFGPYVSENVVPLRAHVERVAEVAIITMAGSENALGEWCFALNNGSMPEEPVMLGAVIRRDGHRRIAIAHETSLIGREYLGFAESAYSEAGLEVVATVAIPQVETDKVEAVTALQASKPDAVVHVGMGHGLWGFNEALAAAEWDPPRYSTTAFEMAYISDEWWQQLLGWIGLDSFDERNEVGQAFLDRFEARYDRRREYFGICYGHDVGTVIARGLAGARPLTGEGVRDAMERIKMVPAASGAPGTCLRFGRFIRQGWMGSDYLVARRSLPDGSAIVFHATPSGR
jgi:ABC-type branched-subunit amino acid transport system substrate-binding protein